MNDCQIAQRTVVAVILVGLTMIVPSTAQRPATGQISGHVVDTVGAGIKGANVFIHKSSPSYPSTEESVSLVAQTDIHGNFLISLPEAGYDVLVTSTGFKAGVESVPVIAGRTKKVQWKLQVIGCDFPGIDCDTFQ